ncbi:flippase [Candidatus Uhrbacteria bacterium]|nr:flippase [Candidatus Uhrbacteria bacterium]
MRYYEEDMVTKVSMTKNSFYSLSSTAIQKALTFIYFIIVARYFGPEDQGRYSTALAFAALFSVFIDIGMSAALTRETAREPHKAGSLVSQMFLYRILFGVVIYGVTVLLAYAFHYSPELIRFITITAFAAVIDVICTSCWAVFRGFQNLKYEAYGGILAIAVMVFFGSLAMILHLPLIYLVYAVLAGSGVNFLYVLFLIVFQCKLSISLRPDWVLLKRLFFISLPFAGAAIFSRVYTFSDIAILTRVSGEAYAGWYSAASKIILALNMIPAAISASIYPAMSEYFTTSPHRLGKTYIRATTFLLAISIPSAVGLSVLSQPIVLTFYNSSYLPTAAVLSVLSGALIFCFLSFPVGALLAASDKQIRNTILFGGAAVINVVLNIFLSKHYQAVGTAYASVATYSFLFFAGFLWIRAYWKEYSRELFGIAGKVCASAAVMALALFIFRERAPLVINILLGCGLYGAMLFVVRIISPDDVKRMSAILAKKNT